MAVSKPFLLVLLVGNTAAVVLAAALAVALGSFWFAAGTGLGVTLLSAFILCRLRQSEVSAVSDALLELNSARRAATAEFQPPANTAELVAAIQRIASEIQRYRADLELELNGLKAILAAMEEGLVVVDSEKRVLMANAAARKMLNFPDGEILNRPLQDLTRLPDLIGNIELSLSASQTCSFEFQTAPDPRQLKDGGKNRTCILARCSSFIYDSRAVRGAVAVLHDITELRRLERVRTEFVANVSHELRTPLTSLMGYLETLHEDDLSDLEQTRKFLLVCRRQAERLSGIVEDLLRLSRLENPQQEIAAAEVNLAEVVNAAVDQCRTLASERAITLDVEMPPRSANIWGDRGLLVQAVSNLVENAIHYNRDKGRVKVRLARIGNQVAQWEIAVSDTGIGIPPEAVARIFERFYRVDKARSRERGGTGLGLSIVRHIALVHGASVHVESQIEQGSTFYLRFRLHDFAHEPKPELHHFTA
jgi:two-component system, OmpR family, phosphate regulon sensor histidine kinase PhoR